MNSSWLAVLLPALVAIAVMFGPGYLTARMAGGSKALAWGLGPLLTLSIVDIGALALSYAGVPWAWWSLLFVAVAVAAATFGLSRVFRPKGIPPLAKAGVRKNGLWIALATAIPAVIISIQLINVFHSPTMISQTTDGVFHLNAVRYMLESGNGSAFAPSIGLNGAPSIYPASWHSVVAMVAGSSGAGIAESVNAVNLVIGGLVWPSGVIFFLRQLTGNGRLVLIAGGILTSCFGIFPFRMLDWGVLYPSFLSIATTLPAVGLIMIYFKRSNSGDTLRTPLAVWLLLCCVPGIFLTQPSGMLMILAIALPLILSAENRLFDIPRALRKPQRFPLSILQARLPANILLVCSAAGVWALLRPVPLTEVEFTVPTETPAQAIGELLWAAPLNSFPSFFVAILIAIGFLSLLRNKRQRWFAVSHIIVSLLFLASASFPTGLLRTFLTGSWYDDYNRVAASLVLTWAPLAAIGAVKALDFLTDAAAEKITFVRSNDTRSKQLMVLGAVVLLGVTFAGSQAFTVAAGIRSAGANFNIDRNARMMSADEQALFEKLPSIVPAGTAVAGDPWDGSALAYYVSGTKMVFGHMFVPMNPDRELIARHLNEAAVNPEVCPAVRRLNVRYVIYSYQPVFDFGYPRDGQYDGLRYIPSSKGFSRVASVGIASLYEVKACW